MHSAKKTALLLLFIFFSQPPLSWALFGKDKPNSPYTYDQKEYAKKTGYLQDKSAYFNRKSPYIKKQSPYVNNTSPYFKKKSPYFPKKQNAIEKFFSELF